MSSVYLKNKNITFVHSPKCAGSSIYRWLINNRFCNSASRNKHKKKFQFVEELKLDSPAKDIFYFSVVRNPFDKIVSWYEYLKKSGGAGGEALQDNFECWFWKHGEKRVDTIFDWVDKTDCILRYERLNEDFKIIQHKLNCYQPLPKYNVSRQCKSNYQDYYTNDSMIDAVYKWDKGDIDYFNYKFK